LNDQGTAPPTKSVRNASRPRWCVKEISWLIINPKSDQLQLPEGETGVLRTLLIHAPNVFGAILTSSDGALDPPSEFFR
jgi:hypothetical protein